jgi:hypothetical protein
MKLWLDDVRHPWAHGCLGWTWAKTAEEAIAALVTGQVTQASLDHDLHWGALPGQRYTAVGLQAPDRHGRCGVDARSQRLAARRGRGTFAEP